MVRQYNQVTDLQRTSLLTLLNEENMTIKTAAERIGISYDNARAICSTYRRQNRMTKVPYEIRTVTRRANKAKKRIAKGRDSKRLMVRLSSTLNGDHTTTLPVNQYKAAKAVKFSPFVQEHESPMQNYSTAAT